MLMNPKGPPLFIFRHYATFSKFFQKKFSKKSQFFCSQSGKSFQSYRAWKAHFGCLESVFKAFHEYVLSIFRKLCAFWALDIAPTLDVPVLFQIVSFKFFYLVFNSWIKHLNNLGRIIGRVWRCRLCRTVVACDCGGGCGVRDTLHCD